MSKTLTSQNPSRFRIGLKVWSGNHDLRQEVKKFYGQGIFDYVELYVDPRSTEKDVVLWKELSVPYRLHAPHSYSGLNLSRPEMEDSNRMLVSLVEGFREMLNPLYVVFHGGTNGSVQETIRQINMLKTEFPALFKNALIENKPKIGLKDENCVGSSVEEIQNIMEATGLGFCLDVGHTICYAHWSKQDWQKVLVAFLYLEPRAFHLSDGDMDSDKDRHDHFGHGNFDLKAILSLIPRGYDLAIETKHDSNEHLDDFCDDASYLKSVLESISFKDSDFEDLQLQAARMEDCKALYVLANEPETRRNSFNGNFIPWETHRNWFAEKLRDVGHCRIYLAKTPQGFSLGYVRFERKEQTADISIAVDKNCRGMGIGRFLLEQGLDSMAREWPFVSHFTAEVKHDNHGSQKLFVSLGFSKKTGGESTVYIKEVPTTTISG